MRIEINISEVLDSNNVWEAAKKKGAPVLGTLVCVPDPDYTFLTYYEAKDDIYIVEWEKTSDKACPKTTKCSSLLQKAGSFP